MIRNCRSLHVEETLFEIIQSSNFGIENSRIEDSLEKGWKAYKQLFPHVDVKKIRIEELDAPLGGGPQADDFSIAIHFSHNISKQDRRFIGNVLEWEDCPNTISYIAKNYSKYDDPIQAYVDEVIFHELGHIIFGFGVTCTNKSDSIGLWACLGLGMLYDQIVWKQFYKGLSPITETLHRRWRDHFSRIQEIDQTLIAPNIAKDEHYNLNRFQIYSHGKAFAFFSQLRENLGSKKFDNVVNCILMDQKGKKMDYLTLRRYFCDVFGNVAIEEIERNFII